jgi:hypothetical protein
MSKKTITILVIVLAVLLGIFFIQKYAWQASKGSATLSELKLAFDPQAVQFIQAFKQDYPDSGLYFARKDTGWVVVNEYNADAKKEEVQKILDDLHAVTGSVRGESEDLYGDFEIDERSALQIKFMGADNSELLHLYVGKGGPDGRSCFMRLPGSPKVYLANENFISRFAAWQSPPEKKLPTDRWINLKVSQLKPQELASFKLHTPKADYEFAQITEPPVDSTSAPVKTWKQISPAKGAPLEENKIRSLQSAVGNLNAQGVANPAYASMFGLDKPSYTVTISDTLGNSSLISFSDKIDTLEQRYLAVGGRPSVYRINKGTFERIFVSPFEKPKEPKKEAKK